MRKFSEVEASNERLSMEQNRARRRCHNAVIRTSPRRGSLLTGDYSLALERWNSAVLFQPCSFRGCSCRGDSRSQSLKFVMFTIAVILMLTDIYGFSTLTAPHRVIAD